MTTEDKDIELAIKTFKEIDFKNLETLPLIEEQIYKNLYKCKLKGIAKIQSEDRHVCESTICIANSLEDLLFENNVLECVVDDFDIDLWLEPLKNKHLQYNAGVIESIEF